MKRIPYFTLIISFLIVLISCTSSKTVSQEQPVSAITNNLHLTNMGSIKFLDRPRGYDDCTKEHFLKSSDFNPLTNLAIRVYLKQPLTKYLEALAPTLSNEELTSNGNYQFTFYIDGELIYEENLNSGAGLPEQKNTYTSYSVPLASTREEDSWGRFLWSRFLYRGDGDKALTDGWHKLRIELRPYVNKSSLIVGDIMATGSIDLEVKEYDGPVDEALVQIQPIDADSGWPLSEASYNQSLIEGMNKNIAVKVFKQITSLVVIKDGELLIEEYFNGATRETLHDPRSVGKSFASTVTGLALRDGYLKSLDQQVSEFYDLKKFENYSSEKEKVSVGDLVSMSSAFAGSDMDQSSPGHEENMYPKEDWVKFTLDLAMDPNKTNGGQFDYFTAGVVLLGDILHQVCPGGLEEYADKALFKPLEIEKYRWQKTPTGVANTAGGFAMRSLDYAKYGQLYKDNGLYKGKQVLPKSWVDASLTKHFSPGHGFSYGYLFWNRSFEVNGKQYEFFHASGNGGNNIFIFKDVPLVIVNTATAYGAPYAHNQVKIMMEKYVLPALLE